MRPPARVRRRISRINCFSEVRCVESRLRLCGQPETGDGFGDLDVELRLRHAEPAADGELGRLDITGKAFAEKSPACWSKVTMLDFRPESGSACSASRPSQRSFLGGRFCAIYSHTSTIQLCRIGPRHLKLRFPRSACGRRQNRREYPFFSRRERRAPAGNGWTSQSRAAIQGAARQPGSHPRFDGSRGYRFEVRIHERGIDRPDSRFRAARRGGATWIARRRARFWLRAQQLALQLLQRLALGLREE